MAGLGTESLDLVASMCHEQLVESGENVLEQGEHAREMFMLLDGRVEVFKQGARQKKHIRIFGPGEAFGEMALLDPQPRSATVVALEPTRLAVFPAKAFLKLYRENLRTYTLILLNLSRELCRRLRKSDPDVW